MHGRYMVGYPGWIRGRWLHVDAVHPEGGLGVPCRVPLQILLLLLLLLTYLLNCNPREMLNNSSDFKAKKCIWDKHVILGEFGINTDFRGI